MSEDNLPYLVRRQACTTIGSLLTWLDDGATILKLLDVVHPAARTLVDIARAQDAEVGDGTTSVTLLPVYLPVSVMR